MPPVTPSPHRFLTGKRRQQSPPKTQNASTAVRHQAPIQRDATPQRQSGTPSAMQFAQTPRFSFGRPASTPSGPKSPAKSSLASALKPSTQPTEDVEESRGSEYDEDDEMLLDNLDVEQLEAWPTTESTQQDCDERIWMNELPYSPKRRRLEEHHPPATESPVRPVFKQPTIPASALNADPSRFTRGSSVGSFVNDDSSTTYRRPAFLRSSLAPPEKYEPLPEAFSPHRRGEKFVPGGMAATLQQWVIETGQSAMQSRRGQGYLGGEDYVLRVKVDGVNGRGPLLATGRQQDGAERRLLLVVNGKKDVIVDVAVGSVVGIRAPTWDIEDDGRVWTVCVDWKVLLQM